MSNSPLCGVVAICLSVHLLMDICIVFTCCTSCFYLLPWFKAHTDLLRQIMLACFTDEELGLREAESLSQGHKACV